MSFLEAVSLSLRTTVSNWKTCVAVVAIYAGVVGLINAVSRSSTGIVDPTTLTPSEVLAAGIAMLTVIAMALLANLLIWPVTLGALSLVGSAAVYDDVIETKGIVRRALDRALDAIGVLLLLLLILGTGPLLVGIVALGALVVVSAEVGFAILIFGVLLLAFPTLYVFVRLSLALPVVMREGSGPVQSLRRSWELVGGAWWWVFGVAVVIALLVAGLTGVVQYLSFIGDDTTGEFIVGAIVTALAAALSTSLYGVASGVVYGVRAPEDIPRT